MNDQEIKKLAEWAGLREIVSPDKDQYKRGIWTDGELRFDTPNFPTSLDDCFKWLFPKLNEKHRVRLDIGSKGTFCYIFEYEGEFSVAKYQAETPAEALCEATLALIEKEE